MKKGLPGCLLAIIVIILIGLGIYYIFKFAANVIPQPLALAAAAIGGVCFIIGKIAGLKKSRVKRTDIKGNIVLANPRYINMLLWGGSLMFVLGLSVTKFVHELFFTDGNGTIGTIVNGTYVVFLKGFLSLGILGTCFMIILKLKNALNDKIVIGDNFIRLDDPDSSKTVIIKKDNLLKIEYVTVKPISYRDTEKHHINFRHNAISKDKTEKETVEIIDPKELNISIKLLEESIKEKGYSIEYIIQ
jgi:hypothetical protein